MEHQKENNSSAGELPRRTPAHNIRVILIEKSLKFKIWHAVKLLHFAHWFQNCFFGLGPFLRMLVICFDFNGNFNGKMAKNRFLAKKI